MSEEQKHPKEMTDAEAKLLEVINTLGDTMSMENKKAGMKIMVKTATKCVVRLFSELKDKHPEMMVDQTMLEITKGLAMSLGMLGRALGVDKKDLNEIFGEEEADKPDPTVTTFYGCFKPKP